MRVAYVGNFDPEFSTENDVRQAFESLGHEVIMLQENRVRWDNLRAVALRSDLLLWTSTWDDAQPLDRTIETMWLLAAQGVPTAALHLDTFWATSRGGRNWQANPMWQCRYVFTADGNHSAHWDAAGVNHYWLPPAVRHTACYLAEPEPERWPYDVAFVGSDGRGYHEAEWPYRKQVVAKVAEICERRGWRFRNPGGAHAKIDRGDDLNSFYATVPVLVGDSLCPEQRRSLYWSDRVPETWGRGGYLIMPRIDAMGLHLGPHPVYDWGDWAELEVEIERGLYKPDERAEIVKRNQELVQLYGTYRNRAETVLRAVGLV